MLTAIEKSELSTLLKEHNEFLIENSVNRVRDFFSFKEAVFYYELQEELLFLETLVDKENVRELFIGHCQSRFQLISGTCFSFTLSQGVCNKLYWDIATLLFKPKTLCEQLQLILPRASILICSELVILDESKKVSRSNIGVTLTRKPIASLNVEPIFNDLENYILGENCLFDVRDISNFDFNLHQSVYEQLQRNFPSLLNPLYQHNLSLRQLYHHILMLSGHNVTLMKKIQSLIFELRLGGENVTGHHLASIDAQLAFTDFQSYLGLFPFELKSELLELTSANRHHSLSQVIEHLSAEKCVEIAAEELQLIIENKSNHLALNTHPRLSQEALKEISRFYGPHNALPTNVDDANIKFPSRFLNKALSDIAIYNENELIDVLSWLPNQMYKNLFQSVSFTSCADVFSIELAKFTISSLFNDEDRNAFFEALIDEVTLRYPLKFAILSNSVCLIDALLLRMSPEERFAVVTSIDDDGDWPLYYAAESEGILIHILELLPEAKRFEAIKIEDQDGFNLLHHVVRRPSCLLAILSLVAEDSRFMAITMEDSTEFSVMKTVDQNANLLGVFLGLLPALDSYNALLIKDHLGRTALHCAVKNIEFLKAILRPLAPEFYFSLLSAEDNIGRTVLHCTKDHPESLVFILQLLSIEERLALVKSKDHSGKTVLHLAVDNSDSLESLLKYLPEESRFSMLSIKDGYDRTVLHCVGQNEVILKVILELLPEYVRFDAISAVDNTDETVMHSVGTQLDSLKVILQLLPENMRFLAVTIRDHTGCTLFYRVADDQAFLKLILQLLSEDDRFEAVRSGDRFGRSILHKVMFDVKLLKLVLELLPEQARFQAVTFKTEGRCVLHSVAPNLVLLKTILELLPEESRSIALNTKDDEGVTVLHRAPLNRNSIRDILQMVPEAERFFLVSAKDANDDTLLECFSKDPAYLYFLLNYLPKNDGALALKLKDSDGRTVLDYFRDEPKWLTRVLQLIQEPSRCIDSAPTFFF